MNGELVKLEREVNAVYPDLRLVVEDGQPFLRGTFPILYEGEALDRYQIEISFPEGIRKLPSIRETGNRIPRISDRHINPKGDICTEVPEIILLKGNYSLLSYLGREVRNFFLYQALTERGEKWPHDEWNHGKPGLLLAYGELLGVSGEDVIRRYLTCLSFQNIKGHFLCPCGSGEKLRKCHATDVQQLRAKIPHDIAKSALKRLNDTKL